MFRNGASGANASRWGDGDDFPAKLLGEGGGKQRFVAGQLARLADGEHFARPGLVFAEYVHPDCRQALLYRVGGAVRGIADEYLGLPRSSRDDDDSLGPCGGKNG